MTMIEAAEYSVVVGVADAGRASVLMHEIENHSRFRIVGTAPNAVLTVSVTAQTHPDVVVLSDESPGTSGRSVLEELARVSPKPLVIVMTSGDPGSLGSREEVARAVDQNDLDAITQALASLAEYLDDPEEEKPERRAQVERRVHQDWTKVFAERRSQSRRTD